VSEDDRTADIENISVHVENGGVHAEVTDTHGQVVECGHRRPPDVDARWRAMIDAAENPS
jgi:hypothetical protein